MLTKQHLLSGRSARASCAKLARPGASFRARPSDQQSLSSLNYQIERSADFLDAELYGHVQTADSGMRGLFTPTQVSTSPTVAVPVASLLGVPFTAMSEAIGADYRAHLEEAFGPMPPGLAALLEGDLPGFSEFPLPQYVQLAACLLWLRGSSGTGRGMGHGAGTVQRGQSKAVSKHRHPLALGWSTYIHEVLPPANELTCLLCLSEEDIGELQAPELMEEARRQRSWAQQVHDQWLGPPAPSSAGRGPASGTASSRAAPIGLAPAFEDTVWALGQVRSRSFCMRLPRSGAPGRALLPKPGGPKVTLMAPLLDLANHHPIEEPPNSEVVLSADGRRLLLRPLRRIEAGEELLTDYGARSNLDLMCDYGFVQPGNPLDCPLDWLGVSSGIPGPSSDSTGSAASISGSDNGLSSASMSGWGSGGGGGAAGLARLAALPPLDVPALHQAAAAAAAAASAAPEESPAGAARMRCALAILKHWEEVRASLACGGGSQGGGGSSGANRQALGGASSERWAQAWATSVEQALAAMGTSLQQDVQLLARLCNGDGKGGTSAGAGPALAHPADGSQGQLRAVVRARLEYKAQLWAILGLLRAAGS